MITGRVDRPGAGAGPLGDYAERWITERPGLRPRTVELYRWLLGKHIDAVPRRGCSSASSPPR